MAAKPRVPFYKVMDMPCVKCLDATGLGALFLLAQANIADGLDPLPREGKSLQWLARMNHKQWSRVKRRLEIAIKETFPILKEGYHRECKASKVRSELSKRNIAVLKGYRWVKMKIDENGTKDVQEVNIKATLVEQTHAVNPVGNLKMPTYRANGTTDIQKRNEIRNSRQNNPKKAVFLRDLRADKGVLGVDKGVSGVDKGVSGVELPKMGDIEEGGVG